MKFLILALIAISTLTAQAQIEFGLAGGLRSNQSDTDVRNASVSSQTGVQGGALAYLPIGSRWGVRSGALYTQRHVDLGPTLQGDVEVRFAYLDVPLTPMFRFTDYGGVFAGPVIAFNQAKDVNCTTDPKCGAESVNSVVIPFQMGLQFRFIPQIGAEVYYEYILGELSKNVSDMRSVGANLIIYFE